PPVIPTLTTASVGSITTTSATAGGNITVDGGASVTGRGVCWATTTGPTITNSKTLDGTGIGSFSSSLTGLNPGMTYFIRAYATNSAGTAYGNEFSFTTTANLSTITTTAITAITSSSATSGGNITIDGGGTITARGVCWSTTTGPTISNTKTTDGTGIGSFVSSLTALAPGTKYYVKAYASSDVTAFSAVTATSGGNVTADGGGTITARGVCWNTSTGPTILDTKTSDGSSTGNFTSLLSSLAANTTYYVRAYATNSAGTAYGNELSFTTTAPALYNNSEWIIDQKNQFQIIGLHANGSKIGIQDNPENNKELIAIYQKTPESQGIFIKIDSELLPRQICINNNILLLDNFTSTTVDIAIIRPNNSIEILREVNFPELASLRKFKKSLSTDNEIFTAKFMSDLGVTIAAGMCIIELATIYTSAGTLGPLVIPKAALDCGSALIGVIGKLGGEESKYNELFKSNEYFGHGLDAAGCVMLAPRSCVNFFI
ncbi:MAG: hypothetical protein NT094_01495, partial [Candidatus Staskawiczbacteria bacterium]|nr:hypothetical protein [Candidatus Staskawiczbacteria bacterium]